MLWWIIGVWLGSAAIVPALWMLSIAYPNLFFPNLEAEEKQAAPEASNTVAAASIDHPKHGVDWLAAWGIKLPGRQPNGRPEGHMGRYALGGLASVGALVLLYVGSSSDTIITGRNVTSPSAIARASETQPVVTEGSPVPLPASPTILASGLQVSAKPAEGDIEADDGVARRGLPHEPSASDETEQITSIELPASDSIANGASPQPDTVGAPAPAPVRPKNRAHARPRGLSALPYDIRSSHGTWLWAPNPNGGGNS